MGKETSADNVLRYTVSSLCTPIRELATVPHQHEHGRVQHGENFQGLVRGRLLRRTEKGVRVAADTPGWSGKLRVSFVQSSLFFVVFLPVPTLFQTSTSLRLADASSAPFLAKANAVIWPS